MLERSSMFLGWQNNTVKRLCYQSTLQIQRKSHQNSSDILHKTEWKTKLKIHMETQEITNSQSNPSQKEHTW